MELFNEELVRISKLIYSDQKKRSKSRGHNPPEYSRFELMEWMASQPRYRKIMEDWLSSGKKTKLKPSCDRINDYIGYRFDNMQLITFQENLNKPRPKLSKHQPKSGEHENIIGIHKKTGEVVEFGSVMDAENHFNMVGSGIRRVLYGERKTAFGYVWSYKKA